MYGKKVKVLQYAKGPDLSLVSRQSTMHETVINAVVGCHYFPPGYFSSQRDHLLGQYQIILLGDRGTQVATTTQWFPART